MADRVDGPGAHSSADVPKIVSVDDHVVEPPHVWSSRLPRRCADVGPRTTRAPMREATLAGGGFHHEMGGDGDPVDWWLYEDLASPLLRMGAAAGRPRDWITMAGVSFDEMRPGCYDPKARLADMDLNWTDASLCFPTFPRFCGQTFLEAKDRSLALLCVRAYNDWMVEEWCAGSDGRLIPLCLMPLWDAQLAADEIHRNAARGVRAVTFSELPSNLGLPSLHDPDRWWEPMLAACNETNTVINIHIGSGSKLLTTSADAPNAVLNTMNFAFSAAAMTDWLMSGVLSRFPNLRVAFSEGQIGWIPYLLERADVVWEENRGWNGVWTPDGERPSDLYKEHIFGCFYRDLHGVRSLDEVGVDNVTFETDYPHSDSTWPHSREVVEEQTAHLDRDVVEKVVRGNAIRMLGLTLDGVPAATRPTVGHA
jgi:predicted TIM-barrel fold metal-dependent hydrolase